jgi:hypothetical protein
MEELSTCRNIEPWNYSAKPVRVTGAPLCQNVDVKYPVDHVENDEGGREGNSGYEVHPPSPGLGTPGSRFPHLTDTLFVGVIVT